MDLGVKHRTLDELYEKTRKFSTLNKALAKAVRDAEKGGNVAYCVDGSASEDNSVKVLQKSRKVQVVDGVSKSGYLANLCSFHSCSYACLSAYDLQEFMQGCDLPSPLIVFDMDDRNLASDVKLLLSDAFGEETEVWFLSNSKKKKIPLYELDRMPRYDYLSAVAVDEIPLLEKRRYTLRDLENIIVRLRRPDGCPWDRVQTPESIKMNGVEEAYELLDAINLDAPDKILEETGDLLMQVVFHAVMQAERGEFNLTDVLYGVCEKLISRHTHIFGGDSATDAETALSVWDKNKMKEKNQDTYAKAVQDVPKCFPALMQGQKVVKRLERGGWNFTYEEAKARLLEGLSRLEQAGSVGEKKRILGECLFTVCTLCRGVSIEGEEALLEEISRVQKDYERFETAVLADGKDVNALSETERERYMTGGSK